MKNKFKFILGLLIILIALTLLVSSFGILPSEISQLLISWQALICIFGIIWLFTGDIFGALISLVVGSYFFLPLVYDVYEINPPFTRSVLNSLFVGSILLLIGLSIIVGRRIRGCNAFSRYNFPIFKYKKNDVPHIVSAFVETQHIVVEQAFKGVKITNAFGKSVFDMSKTELSEGDTELLLSAAFSEVIIIIPYSWTVQSSLQVFFGRILDRDSSFSKKSDRKLIINGILAFGEIEIRRAHIETKDFLDDEDEYATNTEDEPFENITVKHNKNVHIITLEELNYIQADGDYVTLCTKQGNFLKEQTMKYFQNNLPKDKFIRIHRSYIVNFFEISSIDSRGKEIYYVILKDGTSLRASIAGYQKLKQKLGV